MAVQLDAELGTLGIAVQISRSLLVGSGSWRKSRIGTARLVDRVSDACPSCFEGALNLAHPGNLAARLGGR